MRPSPRSVAAVASLALLAGCGGDDDSGANGGITGAEPAKEAPRDAAPEAGAVTASELRKCLEGAGLTLIGEDESYTDADGERVATGVVEIDGSEYVGLALWPSKNKAFVYVAPNGQRADDGEKQMKAFVKAFGGDADEYVQRQGTVLVMLDDEDRPTPEEAKAVDACARGASPAAG